jgi:RNA polymerase sigma-70 factor (ECF subfamily)
VTADSGGHVPSDDIECLVRAMSERLFRIAFRILGNHADAEDAVQNAWINAMRSWPRVGALPTRAEQCAFMVTVVTNEARQLKRWRYRKREGLGVDGKENPGVPEDEEMHLEVKEKLRLAWQAISSMPGGRPAEVIVLYTAGYEYGEIAEMLGIRVGTVRSHMSNAREYLRGVWPDAGEGESA